MNMMANDNGDLNVCGWTTVSAAVLYRNCLPGERRPRPGVWSPPVQFREPPAKDRRDDDACFRAESPAQCLTKTTCRLRRRDRRRRVASRPGLNDRRLSPMMTIGIRRLNATDTSIIGLQP